MNGHVNRRKRLLKRKPIARVFFAKDITPKFSLRSWLRLRKRNSQLAWQCLIPVIVKTLTRSQLSHCAISYNGAVLDVTIHGNKFFPHISYALEHPSLVCCFDVPVKHDPKLDRYPYGGDKNPWRSFARFMTRGVVQAGDCVEITCDCLRHAGINVPRCVASPGHLYRWLEKQGYKNVDFR